MKNIIFMIIDALLFAACIGAPFAAYFYFYGA
jgi:hypothetical protein